MLLVHGFTATPWEMRLLGRVLVRAGHLVLALRLPGHGTTPEDLAGRQCEEWLAATARAGAYLSRQVPRVYGIGQSTGGLVLLAAADRFPLAGTVLLSPYLRLRNRLAAAAFVLRFLRRYQRHPLPADLARYYYDRRPVAGIYQLSRLIRRVRRRLSDLSVPALLISAEGDKTVQTASARELFHRLGSRPKECHIFGREVPHVLTTPENPRWRETFRLICLFLERLEGDGGKR